MPRRLLPAGGPSPAARLLVQLLALFAAAAARAARGARWPWWGLSLLALGAPASIPRRPAPAMAGPWGRAGPLLLPMMLLMLVVLPRRPRALPLAWCRWARRTGVACWSRMTMRLSVFATSGVLPWPSSSRTMGEVDSRSSCRFRSRSLLQRAAPRLLILLTREPSREHSQVLLPLLAL